MENQEEEYIKNAYNSVKKYLKRKMGKKYDQVIHKRKSANGGQTFEKMCELSSIQRNAD